MTAPSVRSTGTVTGTPGGSNINAVIAAPATIVVDDILVLGCLTNATRTLTGLPSGWAHVTGSPVQSSASGGNATLNVVWKRAVAGDVGASTYTFTLNAADYAEGCIESIQGCVNTGSPWDTGTGAPTFAATGSNVTTAPAASLTTTGTDELLYNAALNQTGGTPWTASSGFTKDFDHSGGGSFSTCTGYHKAQVVAGASGSVQPVCPAAGQMVNFLGALLSTAGGSTTSGTLTIAGAGSMAANSTQQATVSATGVGSVSALSTQRATVSAAGVGSVTVLATQQATVAAGGTGTLTALSVQRSTVSAAGLGTFVAPSILSAQVTAAGAGTFTASAAGTVTGTLSMAGAGSMTAGATQRAPVTMAGAGALTANVVQQATVTSAGVGAMTASSAGLTTGVLSIAGAGTFTAVVTQQATVALTGVGALIVAGTIIGAGGASGRMTSTTSAAALTSGSTAAGMTSTTSSGGMVSNA